MTKIKTIYKGNLHCEAEHLDSGVKIMTSAPKDNQGEGDCFSPTDLFAASLGCCMLTIMGIAARTHGFSVDGTEIVTEKVMASGPRRVAELHLQIRERCAHLPGRQQPQPGPRGGDRVHLLVYKAMAVADLVFYA